MEKTKKIKYLFLMVPPWTGSNLIRRRISKCKNAIVIVGQKIWLKNELGPHSKIHGFATTWALHPEIFANPSLFKWDKIRKEWHKKWEANKDYDENNSDMLFVDISQTHPFHTDMLLKHFNNSKFVISIRNPYATILGNRAGTDKIALAKQWVAIAKLQKSNINKLKDKNLFFSYEDVIKNTDEVENKIKKFIPQLYDLKLDNIRDGNKKYLDNIEKYGDKIKEVNKVFKKDIKLLNYFGYELL